MVGPDTGDTNVRVKIETWQRLNSRKRPGDSFDDVITDLLDQAEADAKADAEDTEDDADKDE
jgi:predicted CopG family antitoxin